METDDLPVNTPRKKSPHLRSCGAAGLGMEGGRFVHAIEKMGDSKQQDMDIWLIYGDIWWCMVIYGDQTYDIDN